MKAVFNQVKSSTLQQINSDQRTKLLFSWGKQLISKEQKRVRRPQCAEVCNSLQLLK